MPPALSIDATRATAGTVGDLATLLRGFPGESPVLVDCVTSQGSQLLRLGPEFRVGYTAADHLTEDRDVAALKVVWVLSSSCMP